MTLSRSATADLPKSSDTDALQPHQNDGLRGCNKVGKYGDQNVLDLDNENSWNSSSLLLWQQHHSSSTRGWPTRPTFGSLKPYSFSNGTKHGAIGFIHSSAVPSGRELHRTHISRERLPIRPRTSQLLIVSTICRSIASAMLLPLHIWPRLAVNGKPLDDQK